MSTPGSSLVGAAGPVFDLLGQRAQLGLCGPVRRAWLAGPVCTARLRRGMCPWVAHVVGDQPLVAGLDLACGAGRTRGATRRGCRRSPGSAASRHLAGDLDQPHAKLVDQAPLDQGVVRLGHADRDLVQLAGIDRAPDCPSSARTRLLTATWVCGSGSPARESRCLNAVATNPDIGLNAIPAAPTRVNPASRSP